MDDSGTKNGNSGSVFSKELQVIGNDRVEDNRIDIVELSKKITNAKKNKLQTSQPFLSFKKHQKDGFSKNNNASNEQTLEKIMNGAKRAIENNKINKTPTSVKPPDDLIGDATDAGSGNYLTNQLYRFIEKSHNNEYCIMRKDALKDSQGGLVYRIKEIKNLSDSLKIVTAYKTDASMTVDLGLVCLWNEWIEIRPDDELYIDQELSGSTSVIPWITKWFKVV